MSDYTKVEAASMQQGIDSLQRAYTEFNDNLEELKSQLDASLAQWDGAAQEAYREEKGKWDQSAQKIVEIVTKMTQVLNEINNSYNENEARIQGQWGA